MTNSLKGATGILAVTLLISNILGLVRNVVLASNFSPSDLDIYYAGFQIPNLIFNLLVFGAITTAFIPVFSELISLKKKEESWLVAGQVFNFVSLVLILLSVILAILMPYLIKVVVPGFDAERMKTAISVSRIMFLQAIIFGWSYILGGILNTYKRFIAYSLAPLVYNLAIIVGAFFGSKIGVLGLAWSVVAGALLHFTLQLIPAWRLGFRPNLSLTFSLPVRQIFKLMLPRNLSLGLQQLNFLIFTNFASVMAAGSIAVFNLTNDFQTAPVVIFSNSLAVALFPTLTELASKKDWNEFERVLNKSLRIALFFLIPASFVFLVLRAQIIRLYVGLGKSFDWEATRMAINTLAFFAIGIAPSGVVAIMARAFYALKNTVLPMYYSAISMAISVLIALAIKNLGVGSLSLSLSIASIINCFLLITSFKSHYRKKLGEDKIVKTILMSFFCSIIMSASIWLSLRIVDGFYHLEKIPASTHEVIGLFIQTVIAFVIGATIYWFTASLLLREELGMLIKRKSNEVKSN